MELRQSTKKDRQSIVELFTSVFAKSEGESEGAIIGRLAQELFDKANGPDLLNFVAESDGEIVGSLFFSRLLFEQNVPVFLMAPVAVRSDRQGTGVGQALVRFALKALKEEGGSVAITYGDPGFYGKFGFRAISEKVVIPPYELSQPEGWLGLSLVDRSLETLSGKCSCVEAFRDPSYW